MSISYRKISGDDLLKGLATAGLTPDQFASVYGVPEKRVEKWTNGQAEVPHAVALFVGLIADPQILEKALVITQYMVEDAAPAPAAAD